MNERRVDPLTGAVVLVSPGRQSRPNLPADGCPFCPGGLEAPEPYDVRWFPNRWPALPDGRSEVVLYTPRHEGSFGTLADDQAERVVHLWCDRTEALGARPDVDYVLVFENRGPAVGATIAHPHGQVYAFDEVPPVAAGELEARPCPLCAEDPGDRLVDADGEWRSWVPHAATWPFELCIAPVTHHPDLPAARGAAPSLGRLLARTVRRLDALFDEEMPYLMWVHQRPTDGGAWPTAHVHLHVAPALRAPGTLRYVASAEVGSGIFTNPVDPAEAAGRLRAAGP